MYSRIALIAARQQRIDLLPIGVAAALMLSLCSQVLAGPLSLAETAELRLDYDGAPLIVRDTLAANDGWESADDVVVSETDAGKVVNVYRMTSDTLDYRKEASVRNDVFELTVRFRLYAYKNEGLDGIAYSFYVPAQRLDGASFKALTGDKPYRGSEVVSSTLKADQKDGTVVAGLRYLALTGPCGDIVMDFVPKGRSVYPSWRATEAMAGGAWSLTKQDNFFVFSVGMSTRWYGSLRTSKVLIYEGQYNYDEIHPEQDEWHYVPVPQTTVALAFHEPAPEGFQPMGLQPYLPSRKCGWVQKIEMTQAPAILGGMVTGKQGRLRIETLPGHYLATVRFGAEQPVGPFSLSANGENVATDLHAEAGKVESVTWPVRLRDGKLELAFDAEKAFGISTLLLQRFLTEYEDYAFDRGMWLVDDIPTPDKQVDPGRPGPAPQQTATSRPDDWRWSMSMASFASSNSGSCNELNTYPLIERRMREVVEMGFNTVICNGLHFRLNHINKWPMVERNTKMICEVAHRYGVRVIEHNDVPLMLAAGTGFNVMVEHADWLQRDIKTGKVAAMFCPANPEFKKWYCDWFRRYAKNTGIDGAMLDEVTFYAKNWCGCRHCREQFTAETGYVLPYTDDGTVLHNRDSKVWIAWEKWRIRKCAEFFKGIREIFDEVNPQGSILTYTTHGGFTSRRAAQEFGSDLVEHGRYCDFLGTEIMSRNVFDCYRPVYAYRKTKAALSNHSGRPIYGLVYHLNQPEFAYFGWALLQMNRQLPWMDSIEGYDMTPFIYWKDKMDGKSARPLSEIALLFSRQSCLHNRNTSHSSDLLGCSQMLSDVHIQHDFILDDELRSDILSQYKLLILASTECLSGQQLAAVRNFVSSGGSLIVTARASLCDEDGFQQDNFQLADIIGVDLVGGGEWVRGPCRLQAGGQEPFEIKLGALRVTPRVGTEVLANVVDAGGKPICPAVVANTVGDSRCIYVASQLGCVNYQPEQTAGREYTYVLNEPGRDLLLATVRKAIGEKLQVQAIAVPEKVLLAAYRVPEGYAVHLLNATGVNVKPGDIIPGEKEGEAFPKLNEDIVFDLRVPSLSQARVVSPDYEGQRTATVTVQQDGAYRITVPADALNAYAVVYLQ